MCPWVVSALLFSFAAFAAAQPAPSRLVRIEYANEGDGIVARAVAAEIRFLQLASAVEVTPCAPCVWTFSAENAEPPVMPSMDHLHIAGTDIFFFVHGRAFHEQATSNAPEVHAAEVYRALALELEPPAARDVAEASSIATEPTPSATASTTTLVVDVNAVEPETNTSTPARTWWLRGRVGVSGLASLTVDPSAHALVTADLRFRVLEQSAVEVGVVFVSPSWVAAEQNRAEGTLRYSQLRVGAEAAWAERVFADQHHLFELRVGLRAMLMVFDVEGRVRESMRSGYQGRSVSTLGFVPALTLGAEYRPSDVLGIIFEFESGLYIPRAEVMVAGTSVSEIGVGYLGGSVGISLTM